MESAGRAACCQVTACKIDEGMKQESVAAAKKAMVPVFYPSAEPRWREELEGGRGAALLEWSAAPNCTKVVLKVSA
jgi:hypothetical protein